MPPQHPPPQQFSEAKRLRMRSPEKRPLPPQHPPQHPVQFVGFAVEEPMQPLHPEQPVQPEQLPRPK